MNKLLTAMFVALLAINIFTYRIVRSSDALLRDIESVTDVLWTTYGEVEPDNAWIYELRDNSLLCECDNPAPGDPTFHPRRGFELNTWIENVDWSRPEFCTHGQVMRGTQFNGPIRNSWTAMGNNSRQVMVHAEYNNLKVWGINVMHLQGGGTMDLKTLIEYIPEGNTNGIYLTNALIDDKYDKIWFEETPDEEPGTPTIIPFPTTTMGMAPTATPTSTPVPWPTDEPSVTPTATVTPSPTIIGIPVTPTVPIWWLTGTPTPTP